MQKTDSIHHSAILPAEYSLAELPEHRGNPLIEALPRSPTVENLMDTLGVYPDFHDTDRRLPASVRMQAIMRLNDYFEPLPRHIGLGLQLNVVLRSGYRHRNPVDKEFRKNMVRFYRESMEGNVVPIVPAKPSTAPSFALFGVSGIGKSTAIEQLLAFVPQAICHKDHGFIQLVWLKLDCPLDGSLKQFLISAIGKIDDILGTNYMKSAASGKSIDRLVVDFAKIASSHYLSRSPKVLQQLSEPEVFGCHAGLAMRLLRRQHQNPMSCIGGQSIDGRGLPVGCDEPLELAPELIHRAQFRRLPRQPHEANAQPVRQRLGLRGGVGARPVAQQPEPAGAAVAAPQLAQKLLSVGLTGTLADQHHPARASQVDRPKQHPLGIAAGDRHNRLPALECPGRPQRRKQPQQRPVEAQQPIAPVPAPLQTSGDPPFFCAR
jgi:hypothetical protein